MAEHAFYFCERVRPFWDHVGEWTAQIEPKQLVLLDIDYVVDNVFLPFQGEKRVVFLAILAVAWMVIWSMRKKGAYDDAKFSHLFTEQMWYFGVCSVIGDGWLSIDIVLLNGSANAASLEFPENR